MSAAPLLLFAFHPDRVNIIQALLQQVFPDSGKRTFFLFNHNILLSN
ncbi:hypothetical protein CHCC14821_2212 [Bacillus paralicheniformis]|nr:hypothetical protein CHCC14821_2212 [Bacillus paralicheniformis]TWM63327.1 hypothetical protein CHCC14814_3791 [Bacillus paralicheniformis]